VSAALFELSTGQQPTPSAIKLMPAMRLITIPALVISAPNNSRTTIGWTDEQDQTRGRFADGSNRQGYLHSTFTGGNLYVPSRISSSVLWTH
jgi:hypothetical protein